MIFKESSHGLDVSPSPTTQLVPFNPNVHNTATSIVLQPYQGGTQMGWKSDLMGWKWCSKYLFRLRNVTQSLVTRKYGLIGTL